MWCRDNQVSPHSAPLGGSCRLADVGLKQGSSYCSVKACRTAAPAIHHGFDGGISVSRSPALKDLVKAMFNKRLPSTSLVTSWDLPQALRLLAEPVFESMDQKGLMNLSRKTAFLVDAASERPVSDIFGSLCSEEPLNL